MNYYFEKAGVLTDVEDENSVIEQINSVLYAKLKEEGAKRVLLLPVGGAFHSPFMEPARLELAAAIETAKIDRPICPIFQNVNAKASQNEV